MALRDGGDTIAPLKPLHECQRGSPSFFSSLQADSHYTPDQRRQDSMRTYKHEALRKKFTRARDIESSDEEGYDWGPATDL